MTLPSKNHFIEIALEQGANALVSGELRHDALYAGELCLFDATHYATEAPAMKRLCELLPVESVFIEDKPVIKSETADKSAQSHASGGRVHAGRSHACARNREPAGFRQ